MKKGFTLIELMIVVTIVGILAATVGGAFMGSVSDGTRAGVVTKISRKGVFVKTWEGELMLGSGNSGEQWAFTALNGDVATELQAAQKAQKPVTLHYNQKLFRIPWRADTTYFVDRIEKEK